MRTALAAILLLVLQSALSSFSLGASASAAPLDAWGNPVCATSADDTPHGGDAPAHTKLSPCCMAGCQTAGGSLLGSPPDGGALLAPLLFALDAPGTSSVQPILPERRYRPGNPRAPPLTA